MPIIVNISGNKEYELISEGVHSAVLADVVDLGVVDSSFGPKHKVRFTWLTDEVDSEGQTKYAFKRYTVSLHEKASLRKAVRQILGRDLNEAELEAGKFDIESLIGTPNRLLIQHEEGNDGKTYSNILQIMKPQGPKVTIPADFVRKKDKPANGKSNNWAETKGKGPVTKANPATDDDIPF